MKKFAFIIIACCLLSACASPPDEHFCRAQVAMKAGDYHLAFDEFAYAATYQFPPAEYAIGYMYYYGLGMPRDDTLARQWFIQAANHGNPDARFAMDQFINQQRIPPALQGLKDYAVLPPKRTLKLREPTKIQLKADAVCSRA